MQFFRNLLHPKTLSYSLAPVIPMAVLKKVPEDTQEKIKEINILNEVLTTKNTKLCEVNKQFTENNKKLYEGKRVLCYEVEYPATS